LNTPRDESENESGETEDAWDPSDEQEEGVRKTTSYIWDSMDEEDREDTMDILKQSDEWVIWKSKDKWTKSRWLPPVPPHQEGHQVTLRTYLRDLCVGVCQRALPVTPDTPSTPPGPRLSSVE
jgi:hypothetical protein